MIKKYFISILVIFYAVMFFAFIITTKSNLITHNIIGIVFGVTSILSALIQFKSRKKLKYFYIIPCITIGFILTFEHLNKLI